MSDVFCYLDPTNAVCKPIVYHHVNDEDGLAATIERISDDTFRLICRDWDSGQTVASFTAKNLELLQEKAAYFLNLW